MSWVIRLVDKDGVVGPYFNGDTSGAWCWVECQRKAARYGTRIAAVAGITPRVNLGFVGFDNLRFRHLKPRKR